MEINSNAAFAVSAAQGQQRSNFLVGAIGREADSQQSVISSIAQSAGPGTVTETRGQNLNIVV